MKYTHTIIFLHGLSMNSSDMKYYCDKFEKSFPKCNFKFVLPQAPKRSSTIYQNKRFNSWYDYLTPHCEKEPEINEKQLLQTREKIHKLLDKEIKYLGDPSKVFLSGMSQGCCVAIDAGITYKKKIGGIIGFKGHVITRSLKDFSKRQKIWVCHGKNDKTIFYNFAKKTYMKLKKKNPDIKLLSQDNVNHSVPSGIINQMKSLEDCLLIG